MKKYIIIFSILLVLLLVGVSCASAAEIDDLGPVMLENENLEINQGETNFNENLINDEPADDISSVNDDKLILDEPADGNDDSGKSALHSSADESVDDAISVEDNSDAKLGDSLPDVKCLALDMEDLNLYMSMMDLSGTPQGEAIRQYLSAVYQYEIPKEHSNTLVLHNDVRALDQKIIICLMHGKDIIIDGQGYTVNLGGNDDHDNYIKILSGSVTFKNINFINGYNDDTGDGGAISFLSSGSCTIINSTFKNCWADDYGGAIYTGSSTTLTVINSTFIGNEADDKSGGAIFAMGKATLINSTFQSNKADFWGGAVCSDLDAPPLTIDGCIFRNNYADTEGGAIFAHNLDNKDTPSYFFDNMAYKNGGALDISYFLNPLKNWVFIGNEVLSYNGGAINFYMTESVHSIISCVFIGNKADEDGGAIFQGIGNHIELELINNIFIGNSAGDDGNIAYSNALHTNAYQNWYGTNNPSFNNAIVNYNEGSPRSEADNNYCVFNLFDVESNGDYFNIIAGFKSKNGGNPQNEFFVTPSDLEYIFDKKVDVLDVLIRNNNINATVVTTDFGRINVTLKVYGVPFSSCFDFNKVDPKLSVYCYNIIQGEEDIELLEIFMDERINGEVTVIGLIPSSFIVNIANGYGCAPLNISDWDCRKYDAIVEYFGNEFFSYATSLISFEVKEKSTPENVYGFTTLQNKIIHATDNELILDHDYQFSPENDGDYVDGVIISRDNFVLDGNGHSIDAIQLARIFMIPAENVTIRNVNIINGKSSTRGGAIFFDKKAMVENCTFAGNSANEAGAVYFTAEGTLINSNFSDNHALVNGGAVYFNYGLIENCSFADNNANDGGALYLNGGPMVGCNFTGNSANNGGAVYINYGLMENCIFSFNDADAGGAVYYNGGAIETCNFTGNSAHDGGAIYLKNEATIEGSNFFNNTAIVNGGAICTNVYMAVINSNFTGNYAKIGSAIYSDGTLTIKDSLFLENKGISYTLEMAYENHRAEITFNSHNLYINAVSSHDVIFENVTYWNGAIVNTDDEIPEIGNPGVNITIAVIDYIGMELVKNVTLVTDNDGKVYFNPTDLEHPLYKFNVCHPDDAYYTYIDTTGDFRVYQNSSSVSIDLEDKVEFVYPRIPDRIYFTIVNRTEEVRVLITDMDGNVFVDELTDNDYFMISDLPYSRDYYNITVFNVGNMEIEPSKESKLFKKLKANSTVTLPEIGEVNYPYPFELGVQSENFTSLNITVYAIDGNVVFEDLNYPQRWFDIPVLPVGQYNLTVINNGDENHFESEDSAILNIKPGQILASFLVHDVYYGNPSVFEILVSKSGSYTLNVSGLINHIEINESGKANLSMYLPAGDYEATLSYDDTNYELSGVTYSTFKVLPSPNNVVVSADDVTYGDLTLITLAADVDGIYSLDVNGTAYEVEVINNVGSIELELDSAGIYYATAGFANPNYDTVSNNVTFTVNPALNEVFVIAEVSEDFPDHVSISIKAKADGYYFVVINDLRKDISVVNGRGLLFLVLSPGNYTVKGFFHDPNYETVIHNTSFEVPIISREINIVVKNGENNNVVIFAESNIDGVYMFDVSGTYYPIYIVDGKGNISLPLDEGNYTIEPVLSNEGFLNTVMGSNGFEVVHQQASSQRTPTKIIFKDMKTVAVSPADGGKTGKYFTWRLVDENGNPMANTPMQIGFNGVVYTEKNGIITDADGYAKLQINLGYKGVYTFAICFLGDDDYNASFVVAKITVDTQKATLVAPSKSYAAKAKAKTLTATFKSAKGNPIAGKLVTFKVNGKTYKAKTNAKGVASVNVSLNKKGTYSFIAKFAGDSTYTAVSKTGKLTIK